MYPAADPADEIKLITLERDDVLALQMVCADTKTRCHRESEYGEVEVEQGIGCFYVDTGGGFGPGAYFIPILPMILLLFLRVRKKYLLSWCKSMNA